ncbi:MAG: YybH family protein [Roseimicrobium sp.]
MHRFLLLFLVTGFPLVAQQAAPAQALDAPTHEVAHKDLRELRDAVIEALNAGDIVGILSYLDPDFVFTGPNGDTVRGHRGVREYFSAGMVGAKRKMVDLQLMVEPDSLAILAPDEAWAITYGAGHVRCQLEDGRTLNIDGRWSAVMSRKGEKWLVASIHYSSNIFANAVLSGTRATSAWMALFGVVMALFGGIALGRWLEVWRIRYDAEQAAKEAAASVGEQPAPAEPETPSRGDD